MDTCVSWMRAIIKYVIFCNKEGFSNSEKNMNVQVVYIYIYIYIPCFVKEYTVYHASLDNNYLFCFIFLAHGYL